MAAATPPIDASLPTETGPAPDGGSGSVAAAALGSGPVSRAASGSAPAAARGSGPVSCGPSRCTAARGADEGRRFRRQGGGGSREPAAAPIEPAPVPDDPAPDLALPALDARALARRAALPAALVAAAVMAVIALGGPLQTFSDALGRALDADPRWVVAAVAFEVLSFAGYVFLLWLVGRRASHRLGLGASARLTLGGAAATRLLPTGGVGGAAMTVWAFRRAGLGARGAAQTLLTFLVLLYAVYFGTIAVTGALLAVGIVDGDVPLALTAGPAGVAALAIAAGFGLAFVARRRAGRPAAPPAAAGGGHGRLVQVRAGVRSAPDVLGSAVGDALRLVRSGDPRLLGALAWWGFDAAVLWAMLNAFGAAPPLTVVVLGYLVGQVSNTVPVPGAVSGGMVGVLLAFGVEAALAIGAVLAFRAIAIWLPAPIGLAALGSLRRTVANWGREDAEAASAGRVERLPDRTRLGSEAVARAAAA
jgi:uncharacterized membrane protein YbhN (UPF0104 family)